MNVRLFKATRRTHTVLAVHDLPNDLPNVTNSSFTCSFIIRLASGFYLRVEALWVRIVVMLGAPILKYYFPYSSSYIISKYII